jgi:hypothetical protein
MRHVDAFCHFFPQSLFEKMSQTAGGTNDIGKRMQGVLYRSSRDRLSSRHNKQ